MKGNILIIGILLISVIFSFGCTSNNNQVTACTMDAKICPDGTAVGRIAPNCEFAPCPDANNKNTQLANPASTNCIAYNGTLEIVDTNEGQVGMCTLPDGKVCEEWAFFRGEC
jgi:putative hemolysin